MAKQSNKQKNIPQSDENKKTKQNSLTAKEIFKRADTLLYTLLTLVGLLVAVFLPKLLKITNETAGMLIVIAGVFLAAFASRQVAGIINKYLKK